MDGCWAAWEVGCRIDWQAWAAIAAGFAAIVALFVADRDRRDRRIREKAEARVIAAVLSDDIRRAWDRLRAIQEAYFKDRDFEAAWFEHEQWARIDFAAAIATVELPFLESLLPRLHVLPGFAIDAVLDARSAVRAVRNMAVTFRQLPNMDREIQASGVRCVAPDIEAVMRRLTAAGGSIDAVQHVYRLHVLRAHKPE